MMKVTMLSGSAEGIGGYSMQTKDVEKYYTSDKDRDIDPPGYEVGVYVGGESLSLPEVCGDEFIDLLAGKKPGTEEFMYDRAEMKNRRLGVDMTFSPDKSVSVMWARLDEPERRTIEEAFVRSVKKTIEFTHKNVLKDCIRRGAGGKEREQPKELITTLHVHGASRAGDPQLHCHTNTLNLGMRQDGQWSAVHFDDLFQRQKEIRSVFDAEFGIELERMGLRIEYSDLGPKLADVPEKVIDHFSKRRHQIESLAEEMQVDTNHAGRQLALETRAAKTETSDHDRLPLWQKEMNTLGYTKEAALTSIGKHEVPIKMPISEPELNKGIEAAIHKLSDKVNIILEKDLRHAVMCEFLGKTATSQELVEISERALKSDLLIGAEPEKDSHAWVTQKIIDRTNNTIELARQFDPLKHTTRDELVLETIAKFQARGMSDEQAMAVKQICHGDISLLDGAAGVGKSFSLAATTDIYKSCGYEVIGAAPTGKAKAVLSASAAIENSYTVHTLLKKIDSNEVKLSEKTVLVIDEAGMIGSDRMLSILQAVKDAGAKVILSGDAAQLKPIEAGRPYEQLLGLDNIPKAEILTIRRQKHAWQREVAGKLRNGDISEAMTAYQGAGLIKHSNTFDSLLEQIKGDWLADREKHPTETQLVLAPTNEMVRDINDSIRAELFKRKELLKKDQVSIDVARPNGKLEKRDFTVGDTISLLKNDYSLGVFNGDSGKITATRRVKRGVFEFDVELANGKTTTLNTDKYKSFDHGYAVTVHKSQGDTVDRTYVVPSQHMESDSLYVAATRHRESLKFYMSTEMLHSHVRQYDEEKISEEKIRFHLDKLSKSKAKHQENLPTQNPDNEVIPPTFTSKEIIADAERLKFGARSIITDALYKIATSPRPVEHRYAPAIYEMTDYQKLAAHILKSRDYGEENLTKLKLLIAEKPLGEEPPLTANERKRHYTLVHENVIKREDAIAFDDQLRKTRLQSRKNIDNLDGKLPEPKRSHNISPSPGRGI